jgi:hypothetical protein
LKNGKKEHMRLDVVSFNLYFCHVVVVLTDFLFCSTRI